MTDQPSTVELTTEGCWALLHGQEPGRLAFHRPWLQLRHPEPRA